ncbi:MAG: acyltransferase [Rhodocyclales bacterium]|nr:acyltransferase [Rhodocyclales bacterium]
MLRPTSLLRRWLDAGRGCLAAMLLGANVLVVFSTMMPFALLKLCLPFPVVRVPVDRILNRLAETWIRINGWWIGLVGTVRWQVDGADSLRRHGWYLVGSNHQSWVDILVLQKALTGKIPLLKFFLKRELIYVPLMGLAWWALDFPFMRRGGSFARDLAATRKSCERFRTIPTSVINFLEGTRFTPAKHDEQQSPYRHLLEPKVGGLAMALSVMGDRFRSYLDVTIVYPDGVPTFWDLLCGRMREVVVHVRELELPAIAPGATIGSAPYRRQLTAWVNEMWQAKDCRIDEILAARAAPVAQAA